MNAAIPAGFGPVTADFAVCTAARDRGQRGFSVSVLVCLLIPTMLVCIGLAVDGAAKAAADHSAEAVAAQAARAGMDAAAPALVSGLPPATASQLAISGAQEVLASHPDIEGSVSVGDAMTLEVTTSTTVPTIFLSLAGIDRLTGRGFAAVELRMR